MHTNSNPTDLRDLEAEDEREALAEAERRRRDLEDLRWLLGHAQGRRFAARVLEQAGVHRSSFNNSGSLMAFHEGRRDIGLWLIAELTEANADGYFKLLREYARK